MKKLFVTFICVISVAWAVLSTAHAEDVPLCMQIWALPICLPLYTSVLLTGLTSTVGSKEVYVQALRDDAANYVADRGEMTALLKDAVTRVRAQNPNAADKSDDQIVLTILENL